MKPDIDPAKVAAEILEWNTTTIASLLIPECDEDMVEDILAKAEVSEGAALDLIREYFTDVLDSKGIETKILEAIRGKFRP